MQLVVRHRVQGLRIDPACILTVDHLAHQPELRLHLVREVTKRMLEAHIEHVGTVETETIDVEGIDPVLHDIDQIFTDALAVEVQLRELPGTAPCTVVEAVAPWGTAIETNALVPVLIRTVPALLLDILKRKEATTGMVEHGIDDDTDAVIMRCIHEVAEVCIGPQSTIDGFIIRGVVAMTAGLEERADVDGIAAEHLQVRDEGVELRKASTDLSAIVLLLGTHHAERIHMIKNSAVIPGHIHLRKKAESGSFRTKASIRSSAFFRSSMEYA